MAKNSPKVTFDGKTYMVVGESVSSVRLTNGPETIIVPKDKVKPVKESKDVQDKKVAEVKKGRPRKG